MSKRNKSYKRVKNNFYRKNYIEVDPEIKKGIFVIVLLAITGIILLSLFDFAGELGAYINHGLILFFGWSRFIVPIFFLIISFAIYSKTNYIRGSNALGAFLLILSFSALLHLFIPVEQAKQAIYLGKGGGYVGLFLSNIFLKTMKFWASLIVIGSLFLISISLTFNITFYSFLKKSKIILNIFKPFIFIWHKITTKEEKYEDEDEIIEPEEIEDEDEKLYPDLTSDKVSSEFTTRDIKGENNDIDKANELKQEPIKQTISQNKIKHSFSDSKYRNVKVNLPIDLLQGKYTKPNSGDVKTNQKIIKNTLKSFNINVEMVGISVGPTVTQYTLKPAEGVKLSQITTLHNDLSLALAAHPIRIEAPIPGKSLVGIEIPNQKVAVVRLKEIISSHIFKERKSNMMIALGKDVSGKPWIANLEGMPHLLVAGATGSGKSVMLNSIIISLLYQNSPANLKFILIDPKRVELTIYNNIPYLLAPVITEVSKTINALKWAIGEMEKRFEVLSQAGKRDIGHYNRQTKDKMPYIVIIIDELADLMTVAGNEIEGLIVRLAQMSRAVGIHLILSTQRPSVNIITGLIKANVPNRIAFSVTSMADSRTIIDCSGAEKLLGKGDLLFLSTDLSKPVRLQAAYVSDDEAIRVAQYLKRLGPPEYDQNVTEKQASLPGFEIGRNGNGNEDELLEQAKEQVARAGKASASLLQRRLRIGYARAARLLDLLEEQGIIGPSNGAKPREVLLGGIKDNSIFENPNNFYGARKESPKDDAGDLESENSLEKLVNDNENKHKHEHKDVIENNKQSLDDRTHISENSEVNVEHNQEKHHESKNMIQGDDLDNKQSNSEKQEKDNEPDQKDDEEYFNKL